ncbi:hypothetical protein G6F70_003923 [Rhizopus microsporus]|nr:hypothetical protein G6F71_002497 [Rhizopus microsporus]KAG1200598.1 hypothetical protein G6F70_003923 [Rhizopus microsporus]
MSFIYLALELEELSQPNYDLLQQATALAINEKAAQLVVGTKSKEIKDNLGCIDAIWDKIQTFLGHAYVAQIKVAYKADNPLFNCNIVFEDVCGYSVYLEPNLTKVCVAEKDSAKIDAWNQQRQAEGLGLLDKHILHLSQASSHSMEIKRKGPIEPRIFQRVAVGGTFDHLHAGHKILLTMTALLSDKSMVVGVTDDCMLQKKKHKDLIAPTMKRVKVVQEYLHSVKRGIQYEVVPITDPFGPTVTDPTIDGLVVSKETLKGGELVNNERDMRGYPPLELRIIDVISSESNSIEEKDMSVLKISSSWIREYIASNKN